MYLILFKWIFNPSGKSGKKFVESFAAVAGGDCKNCKYSNQCKLPSYKARAWWTYVRQQKFIINFFLTWKSFANCVHWIFFSFAVFFSSLHKSLRTLWKWKHQIWVTYRVSHFETCLLNWLWQIEIVSHVFMDKKIYFLNFLYIPVSALKSCWT